MSIRVPVTSHTSILLRAMAAGCLLLVMICLPVRALAANLPFPGNGWTNPVAPASFEDWHFGSCDGYYEPGRAHLGTDSQGTHAGQVAVAMAEGRVVKVVPADWGPGGAAGIEHVAADGTHFVAVYGHVNLSVGVGARVTPGQAIGTLYDQGSNSHLHLGVRPLAPGEDPANVTLWGRSKCADGSAPTYGFVNPIPWLASHDPRGSGAPTTQLINDLVNINSNGDAFGDLVNITGATVQTWIGRGNGLYDVVTQGAGSDLTGTWLG